MATRLALLTLVAVLLAALLVVGVSWWTRNTLYTMRVTGYCISEVDLMRFRNGSVDTRSALAGMIISGGEAKPREGSPPLIEWLQVAVLRRIGFLFISRDEQFELIQRLPECPPEAVLN